MFKSAVLLAFVLSAVNGQQVGTNTAEVHPSLPWKRCTVAGGCTTVAGTVALDANWRWTQYVATPAHRDRADRVLQHDSSKHVHQLLHWQYVECDALPQQPGMVSETKSD